MCGIAGYLCFRGEPDVGAQTAIVRAMAQAMAHRGPDDAGVWVSPDGRCALSHRRLSIIDVSSAGHQPMLSDDGRFALTYNGEIYDYRDHRRRLEERGAHFRTATDTEVLLQALVRDGDGAIEQLDGMFAFGLYDTANAELLLARDPFGEKPLYYLSGPGFFAFASELHALQEVPGFDATVDLAGIAEYLCLQYVDAPRTLYRSVQKLPPGCAMRVDARGGTRHWRHFDFSPGRNVEYGRSLDDWADELEAMLLRSLERRLIADVPLGAFLSGGIDSSTVVALATKRLGVPIRTFSIGFEGSETSEHVTARRIAEHLGSEHSERVLKADIASLARGLGRIMDEPNGDTSCLPTFLLSEFTREQVTVAISGDGGDELFGGYTRYPIMCEEARRAGPSWSPGRSYYGARALLFSEEEIAELFGFVPRSLLAILAELREEVDWPPVSLLDRLRRTDARHYLPGAVLAKVDRMSMQHSLEVRTPFLTREIARFAERLPQEMVLDGSVGKVVLRHLAGRYLPEDITRLPKVGFGPPPSTGWGRGRFLNGLRELIDEPESRLRPSLGDEGIEQFLGRQERGDPNIYQLAALTTLESYLRSHAANLPAHRHGTTLDEYTTLEAPPSSTRMLLREIETNHSRVTVRVAGSHLPSWMAALPEDIPLKTDLPVAIRDGRSEPIAPRMEVIVGQDASVPLAAHVLEDLHQHRIQAILCTRGGRWYRFERDASTLRLLRWTRPFRPWVQPTLRLLLPVLGVMLGRLDLRWIQQRLRSPRPRRRQTEVKRRGSRLRPIRTAARRGLKLARRLRLTRLLTTAARGSIYLSRRLLDGRTFVVPLNGAAPFRHNQGLCWQARYTHRSGPRDVDLSAEFALYEDGVPLSRPGSDKRAIRALGAGRYWIANGNVFFSSSDGSDPNRNGRQYYLMPRRGAARRFQLLFRGFTPGDLPGVPLDAGDARSLDLESRVRDLARRPAACDSGPPPERVLMLTSSLGPGGTERQLTNLACHFRLQGHDVSVVCLDQLGGRNSHYLPGLWNHDIRVRSVSSLRDFGGLSELSGDALAVSVIECLPDVIREPVWNLALHMMYLRPDFVHCHLDHPNVVGGLAALIARVPRILLSGRSVNPSHFTDPPAWMQPLYRALAGSDRIVLSANSVAGARDYASWLDLPEQCFSVIRNGLDPKSFELPSPTVAEALRRELDIAPGVPTVAGVFRVGEEKRPFLFLDTIQQLRDRLGELVILHAGDGPLFEEFCRAIRERGLEDCIRVLGRRDDVPAILSLADLVLLTSRQEGTPNVLLEAQFLGVPVVSSDAGGAVETFSEGESGFLCRSDSAEDHAQLCLGILNDPARREAMGQAARRFARTHFSLEKAAEDTLATLRGG